MACHSGWRVLDRHRQWPTVKIVNQIQAAGFTGITTPLSHRGHMTRKKDRTSQRHHTAAWWNIEMFESPLMDSGIAYIVNDAPAAQLGEAVTLGEAASSWIEFPRPTQSYRNLTGTHEAVVRLTVTSGRLAITAPGLYPPDSLVRTTDPPPDRDGNLRIMRLGDDDMTQIDLCMASDGVVTATLRLETLRFPFNRGDIVQIADEFAVGIDFLDFAVRKSRLLILGGTGHGE